MTALLLSEKMFQDDHHIARSMSKASRIPLAELVQLEIEFLVLIQYDLYISNDEYNDNLEWINNVADESTCSKSRDSETDSD